MELSQVTKKEEFALLYEERGLKTTKEKIEFLQDEMGIFCTRFEAQTTDDDILSGLQLHALVGWSKGSLA